jgi:hypothetical protein
MVLLYLTRYAIYSQRNIVTRLHNHRWNGKETERSAIGVEVHNNGNNVTILWLQKKKALTANLYNRQQ